MAGPNSINQRNVTRNTSFLDIEFNEIFIGHNRFENADYLNNTGGDVDVQTGLLVVRDTTTPGQVIPATNLNLPDVIGIVSVDGTIEALADTETARIAYCNQGDIDESFIILPAGVADLDFAVGNKTLRDVLNALGLHLQASTENTSFDN